MSKVILMDKFRAKKEEEKHIKEYFYREDGRLLRTETEEIIELFDEKERLKETKIINMGISTIHFYDEDTNKLNATQDYKNGITPIKDTLIQYRYLENTDIIDYGKNNKEIITYDELGRKKTLRRKNEFINWFFKYSYLKDTNEEILVEQFVDEKLVSVTNYNIKKISNGIIKINSKTGETLVKKYDKDGKLVYKEDEFSIVEYIYEDSKIKKEIIWFKNGKFDELI